MNLYIEVENGKTKNHPALEENLLQVFGSIPSHWEPFVRVERPILGVYEVMDSEQAVYEKVDGTWTDIWLVRPMTDAEKTAKQNAVKNAFASQEQAENWAAWIFDETICSMVPPIPRPAPDSVKLSQNIFTFWCGAENNWKDTPPRPTGNNKFDFFAWNWVEVIA